jgi:hypothetical protein
MPPRKTRHRPNRLPDNFLDSAGVKPGHSGIADAVRNRILPGIA